MVQALTHGVVAGVDALINGTAALAGSFDGGSGAQEQGMLVLSAIVALAVTFLSSSHRPAASSAPTSYLSSFLFSSSPSSSPSTSAHAPSSSTSRTQSQQRDLLASTAMTTVAATPRLAKGLVAINRKLDEVAFSRHLAFHPVTTGQVAVAIHRELRRQVRDRARDADVLNLFCYTGVASCYAAAGGARSTTSVDLSNTYVNWARENLEKNGCFEPAHTIVKADCLQWLQKSRAQYDLIFCDPPTFSNSKSMRDTFDVQRDHVELLEACMQRLRRGGVLLFSNNFRRFKMDNGFSDKYAVKEISDQTRAPDFERSHGHRAFEIRQKE